MRTRPQSSRQSVSVIFGMAAAGVSRGQTNGLSNFGQKARSDYSFKRNENGPGRGAVFLGRDRGRDGWRLAHYRPIKIHHSHNAHSASRFRDSPSPAVAPVVAARCWAISPVWRPPRPASGAARHLRRGAGWARRSRCWRRSAAIDLQILHDTLHVVARLGERDALDPIDRIDFGIARIAVLRHPLPDPAAAGIVAGKRHDVGAGVLLEQGADLGGAHLGVVDRIGHETFPIVGRRRTAWRCRARPPA